MRLLVLLVCIISSCFSQSEEKLFVKNTHVSFFSWAPLEDITAVSNKLEGVVDLETGSFYFRIPINTFVFPSSLMQQHFNDNYMESDKYPISSFKGTLNKSLFQELSVDDVFSIEASGLLSIHGITQDVIIDVFLEKKSSDKINMFSEFDVALKAYKIKVPKIVNMNIADTILVKVVGQLILE